MGISHLMKVMNAMMTQATLHCLYESRLMYFQTPDLTWSIDDNINMSTSSKLA